MSVWVVFPSANEPLCNETAAKWRAQGYRVAVFHNTPFTTGSTAIESYYYQSEYQGYWRSVNYIVERLGKLPELVVAAADDIDPDPNHTADEIAAMYFERFPDGFGLLQPTGDRQGDLIDGKWNSQRICGSPWFGRGWIERAYQGKGPMPTHYGHYFGDEELQHVAQKLGVLYQRDDLAQFHRHWSWGWRKIGEYNERNQHLWWEADACTFKRHRAEGFPGSEPLFFKVNA